MALILIDGCEDLSSWTLSGVPTIVAGRNGNAISLPTASQLIRYDIATADQTDTVTLGWATKIGAYPAAASTLVNFNSDAGATNHNRVQVGTAGQLSVTRVSTALITSATGVLPLNTWTYIEVTVKLSDTVGTASIRVNGTSVASGTALDTKNAGTKTVYDMVQLSGQGSSVAPLVDDVYISNDATMLGDIKVETLYPNGNGNANAWVGSDGDSVNNYLLVNETGTPVTTTYTGSPTSGAQDMYTLSDLVTTSGTVLGVCHQTYAAASDATNAKQLRIVNRRSADTKTNGLTLSTTYGPLHYTLATDPETGSAYTIANVNALQSGVEVTTGLDALFEPFNTLAGVGPWSNSSGSPSIVTGRTGTAMQMTTATANVSYQVPAAFESATFTIGLAWRTSSLGVENEVVRLTTDSQVTNLDVLDVTTAGAFVCRLGSSGGGILATSASGAIAINTWYYLEAQLLLHTSAGSVILRIDGTQVANVTGVTTKLSGTKTVFDSFRLGSNQNVTVLYDDLYLTTGAGAAFKGSITL